MKKRLIDAGILAAVFIAAVFVFSYLTNRGSDNMTADLGNARLPGLAFTCEGYQVNHLAGYVKEMDAATMRDAITPVNGGQLEMNVQPYDNKIDSVHYGIYSIDGEQKIAENTITEVGDKVVLSFDETQIMEERQLIVTLKYDQKEAYYYTRIIAPKDFYVAECLNYISNFHQNTLSKGDSAGVGAAIEPTKEGDNSTFGHVTIHSNYEQVTWGKLSPSVVGAERLKIVEANPTFIAAVLEYEIRGAGEENEEDIYRVKEFYRVRMSGGTMYLLDYDRTAEQIFDADKKILNEKGIILGVAPYDVPYMINEDGTIVSFIQAGELWNYNRNTDEISLVFSFMAAENTDVRNLDRNHTVKLLAMDKAGNTTFAVYGYMSRGMHEGEAGAAIYYFSIDKNCIEEKAFIPSDKSAAIAESEFGKLVYYSIGQDRLYVMVENSLYEINMSRGKKTALVENLEEGQYVVSDDGHLVAYQSNGKLQEATELVVKDLRNGEAYTVSVQDDECIRPLGFVNNDLVSGTAKKADAGQAVSGETITPMYKLEIRESDNKVIETSQTEGIYILDTGISDGMITINRVAKNGNVYTGVNADYITSNEDKEESNISLSSYVTELKETQMQITFADGIPDQQAKLLKPKQVLMEKPELITFDEVELDGRYYVYGLGELKGIYRKAGYAVRAADEIRGTVVTSAQQYVWERGNRSAEFTISDKDDVIAMMRDQLNAGKAPMDVLNDLSDGNGLDLSGCTTEEVLYNVNKGTPVIGMIDGAGSVILTGYNKTNVFYVDTAAGSQGSAAYEEMDQMLAGSGRAFIGYLRQ